MAISVDGKNAGQEGIEGDMVEVSFNREKQGPKERSEEDRRNVEDVICCDLPPYGGRHLCASVFQSLVN